MPQLEDFGRMSGVLVASHTTGFKSHGAGRVTIAEPGNQQGWGLIVKGPSVGRSEGEIYVIWNPMGLGPENQKDSDAYHDPVNQFYTNDPGIINRTKAALISQGAREIITDESLLPPTQYLNTLGNLGLLPKELR